jgi:hypothetical protein
MYRPLSGQGEKMFEKGDQEWHDRMLNSWAKALIQNGFTSVRLSLSDSPNKPDQVGQHIPDLMAISPQNQKVIGEVKTPNDIDKDHTKEQLNDYVRSGSKVMLLVPEKSVAVARGALEKWGFDNKIVELWQSTIA